MSKQEKSKKKDAKADSTCRLNTQHEESSARQSEDRSRSTLPQRIVPLETSSLNDDTNGGSESSTPEPRREHRNRSRSRRRNRQRSHSRSRNAQSTQAQGNFEEFMETILSRGRVAGHIQAEIFFDNLSEPEAPEASETFVFSFSDENDLI